MSDLLLRLMIRDLLMEDLPAWSDNPNHVIGPAQLLERVPSGGVEYLVACLPSGALAGKLAIDYDEDPGAGTLTQFDVHEVLRSCGIGTALVGECERRMRARGVERAELAAEVNNPRAQALYERLGYVVYGQKRTGWDQDFPDGTYRRYEATIVQLRKKL